MLYFALYNYGRLLHFHLILQNEVRGMMYFRQALELQAFLDMAKDEGTWRNIH